MSVRYSIGMRIQVMVLGGDAEPWAALLHNVSGGGIGFWCPQKLAEGTHIAVRESTPEHASDWVRAHVAHCSLGIKGYLIGAMFEEPLPAAAGTQLSALHAERDPPQRGPRDSLRARCHAMWAAAALLGMCVTAGLSTPEFSGELWMPLACGLLSTLALGTCGERLVGRQDLRFQQRVVAELKRLANGEFADEGLPEAPSQEFVPLRRALVAMRAKWRKRDDEQRVKREKLEELNLIKSNILSMVSHDLRTPLTSILLYTQMLREAESLTGPEQAQFLEIIVQECTRLSRLVDDLLEAQRLQSGRTCWQIEKVDVSEAIRSCFRLFDVIARSRGIELSLQCPESLPPIEADADKMSQVVSNLLSNAVKYVHAGGRVCCAVTVRGKEIVICVEDNGPGIPRDQWDQIFDRFAQLSAARYIRDMPGVGLGLFIVRQIVERHGGRVWVDSEVGRGSAFYVSLPIRSDEQAAEAPIDDEQIAGRVLVCDADPDLATRIAQALRQLNYEVRLAHSGCRLLSQIEQMDFDVVLTDILLPDVDAGDIVRSLVARRDGAFRLVIHSYAGDGEELRRLGADVFLQRPATREDLAEAVRAAMQKRAESGATVLLVASDQLDLARLRRAVSEAGHLPLTADSLKTAGSLLRNYPVDYAVFPEALLGTDWEGLQELIGRRTAEFVVVCPRVGRRERRLADHNKASAVVHRPGFEDELVARIAGHETPHAAEVV